MTSVEKKQSFRKKKICLFSLITIITLVLILGIKSTYAYYHDRDTFGLLSGLVGDFDSGTGDINILIYKENDQGDFGRVYRIPEIGYIFDDELTECSIPCSNTADPDYSGDASCHYTFNGLEDDVEKAFSLTSNEKVTCKFKFRKETEADIKVFIMKEDKNGTETHTDKNNVEKKYSIVEDVPAYGYIYSDDYVCDKPVESLTYDAASGKFTIATRTKNVCYAYFNSVGDADAIVKVYLQSAKGSEVYKESLTIPNSKTYKISENSKFVSACYTDAGVKTEAVPTYKDGYINVEGLMEKQTCQIYLDLVEE